MKLVSIQNDIGSVVKAKLRKAVSDTMTVDRDQESLKKDIGEIFFQFGIQKLLQITLLLSSHGFCRKSPSSQRPGFSCVEKMREGRNNLAGQYHDRNGFKQRY